MRAVVSGLLTLDGTTIQRQPLNPHVTVHTWLLKSNTSSREQAHKSHDLVREAVSWSAVLARFWFSRCYSS